MSFSTDLKNQDLETSRPNPQKRNILIMRLARAPWWLLIILTMVLAFVITAANSAHYRQAWDEVRKGIWTTIWVTLVAYTLACLMGLILALLRRPSKSLMYNIFVFQPVTVWVELIRGIPTLVLLFYIVLALIPEGVRAGNDLGEWMLNNGYTFLGIGAYLVELHIRDVPLVYRAIMALSISYSAFLSEIFRAGLESIDIGQREAARSLGMSSRQVMRYVILPQAIRNVIPPLANDFIAMLKESSLVSAVGVDDITRMGRNYNSATFTVFYGYNIIVVTYLVMTLGLSMIMKAVERYFGRSRSSE
ncbi:MAG TPA: amino acid ABC transporter permease [Aggregatilineales bacterium]|nr:amino acid ABC transporter permease [Aggregatilineales bacterium]